MADMPELKPCPFCGGKAVLRSWYESGNHIGESRQRFEVECVQCPLEAWKTFNESVAAWNTRADLIESIEGLDEALSRSGMWQPSASAKMAYDDYNIFVQAARLFAQGRTQAVPEGEAYKLCHEAYEIYAGMEGGVPETAYEGYLLQEIEKMAIAIGKAKSSFLTAHISAAPPVTGGAWLPIDPEMKDTWPPHDQKVLLFHWYNGQPLIEIDCYSQGRIGMRSHHSWATHWQPLPAPPSSAEKDK